MSPSGTNNNWLYQYWVWCMDKNNPLNDIHWCYSLVNMNFETNWLCLNIQQRWRRNVGSPRAYSVTITSKNRRRWRQWRKESRKFGFVRFLCPRHTTASKKQNGVWLHMNNDLVVTRRIPHWRIIDENISNLWRHQGHFGNLLKVGGRVHTFSAWSLGINKLFNSTFHAGRNYSSMLWLNLYHVRNWLVGVSSDWCQNAPTIWVTRITHFLSYILTKWLWCDRYFVCKVNIWYINWARVGGIHLRLTSGCFRETIEEKGRRIRYH